MVGRPKNVVDAPEEPKKIPDAPKKVKLGIKIVSYGEYLQPARELLAKQDNVNGMVLPLDVAIAMIYDKHEVIGTIQTKGETKYVCKV